MFFQEVAPVRDLSSSAALLVRAGSSRYRVRGLPGTEVARCPALATVPDAPQWLLGIGLYKNVAIPVIHLQALLEGQAPGTVRAARLLVMRAPGCPLAYLVDDVDPAARINDDLHDVEELDLPALGRVLMAHAFLDVRAE
jgi:chemotaxis signal transduction protein